MKPYLEGDYFAELLRQYNEIAPQYEHIAESYRDFIGRYRDSLYMYRLIDVRVIALRAVAFFIAMIGVFP